MKKVIPLNVLLATVWLAMGASCKENPENTEASVTHTKPNIIIIYADDLGYGELGAYGATELKTPHLDALANGGMRFTQGYATSATCTPSRYALLTGIYPWRNEQAKILPGTAPLIIDTSQTTLPKMLKKQGYHTGIVGKWHLGLGTGHVDWNKQINPGPNEVGFDYSHILAATQDRVPTVYIENGRVVNLDPNDPISVNYQNNFEGEPTGLDNPELLKMKWHHGHNNSIVNGIPRIGFMKGGETAKWVDEEMADYFLAKAQAYVKAHKREPFFLYYALQQPHVPRTPHPRFVGASGMGPRGDVIVEADAMVGAFVKTLESEGLLENTLIVFSSDNGPVVNDGYYDDAVEKLGDHKPAGVLRGGKYSLFEAGTRVPFFTYWKGKISPGVSDAMVSQLDLFSSLAALVDSEERTGDSLEFIDLLLGKSEEGREELVIEATSRTAFRQGDWALIPPYDGPAINTQVNIELANSDEYLLYNLKEDIGQRNNLAKSNPEKLQELIEAYEAVRGTEHPKGEPRKSAKKESTISVLKWLEKDEFLKDIGERLKGNRGPIKTVQCNRIIKSISERSQNNWAELKLHIAEVSAAFFKTVAPNYKYLTLSNQRICALNPMNFSSKERSRLSARLVESAHTNRDRLQKKWDCIDV